MTTKAKIGLGTTFHVARPNAPTTWLKLDQPFSVSGSPSLSRDAVDGTHMDSEDGYREFVGGLRDGGELSVEMNHEPGDETDLLLLEAFNDDEAWQVKITLPNGATWVSAALITSYEASDPLEDKMTCSAGFKISGKPVLTEPA